MEQILGSIRSSYRLPDMEGTQVPPSVAWNPESYRNLTLKEGREIALAAIERYNVRPELDDLVPQEVLTNVAKAVPGALKGLAHLFLERRLAFAEEQIFREADAETRDQIVTLLETGNSPFYTREDLLNALAWIGDEPVQSLFHGWRITPPAWQTSVNYPLDHYPTCGGWELTPAGTRRDIYFQANYELVPAQTAPENAIPGSVAVVTSHEGTCGWCGLSLLTLFDIDLQDPRMQFFGVQGTHLRIALCPNCSFQGPPTFTEIDGEGKSVWSSLNGEPWEELIYPDEYSIAEIPEQFPPRKLVLGQARKTPYQDHASHLGGCPGWTQFPDYPHCPRCQHYMTFVGQYLYDADIYFFYAYLCASCGIAAVNYQQT